MEALSFQDLILGQVWTTPRRTVTESDVVNFAGMTGDYNALHCDHDFAASTPFRKPIAHGLLGISWVAGLGSRSPSVDTVAFAGIQNWQFLHPIFIGDTVYAELEVAAKESPGRRTGQVTWMNRLLNTEGKILQQGEFITLVRVARPNSIRRAA